MTKDELSLKRKFLRHQNRFHGTVLNPLPRNEWAAIKDSPEARVIGAYRSSRFLVTIYQEGPRERLTVCRTDLNKDGMWQDGITWDELMEIKRRCGRGDQWAVEIYPPDASVVNVANMRHLWILPEAPAFGWKLTPPDRPLHGRLHVGCIVELRCGRIAKITNYEPDSAYPWIGHAEGEKMSWTGTGMYLGFIEKRWDIVEILSGGK